MLGQMLSPAAVQASVWVQRFAGWLHDLSPGMKSFLGNVAVAGVALTGFAVILGKFAPAIDLAIRLVATAIQTSAGRAALGLTLFAAAPGAVFVIDEW